MDAFREQEPEEGYEVEAGRGSLRGQVIVFGCLIERHKDRHGFFAHMHDVNITSTVPPMARQEDRLGVHDAVKVKGTFRRQTHQSVGEILGSSPNLLINIPQTRRHASKSKSLGFLVPPVVRVNYDTQLQAMANLSLDCPMSSK